MKATSIANTRGTSTTTDSGPAVASPRLIKVLVWDLDNTLWDGTLLEGDELRLRPGVRETLQALDERGILHSIASKNEPEPVLEQLRAFGLEDFFLCPQIGWGSKAASVERIAKTINVGIDALAFIDDQAFERAEVAHALPDVLVLDAAEADELADRPEFMPRFLTDESKIRRQMYRADFERQGAEEGFQGPAEDFLATLEMRFSLAPARREDLQRAEELTQRTHQLNTTGYTYDYDELETLSRSPDHLLLVASLDDRFGTYGKIGLALVEKQAERWNLKLLLMSCRVMSRGVGTLFIQFILRLAQASGARLFAEFRPTDRNRMMRLTYGMTGFKEVERRGDLVIFENTFERLQPDPPYVEVTVPPELTPEPAVVGDLS